LHSLTAEKYNFQRFFEAFIRVISVGYQDHAVVLTAYGKKLNIDVILTGNFGTGGQEAAMDIVNEFKTRLSKKIGL